MKKIAVISFLIAFMYAITPSSGMSDQSTFSIRNGLAWGTSKDDVISSVKSEPGSTAYVFTDATDGLFSLSEDQKTKVWALMITGITLGGPDDEQVIMICEGTEKEGLFVVIYMVYSEAMSTDEGGILGKRFAELQSQIEKKYNVEFANIDYVWETEGDVNKRLMYTDHVNLQDGTEITLAEVITRLHMITIAYNSDMADEIYSAIKDGSYFIETPFGL